MKKILIGLLCIICCYSSIAQGRYGTEITSYGQHTQRVWPQKTLRIPSGATTVLNDDAQPTVPGALFYNTVTGFVDVYDGSVWNHLAMAGVGVDSVTSSANGCTDSLFYWSGGSSNFITFIEHRNGLVEGTGNITNTDSTAFHIDPAAVYIACTRVTTRDTLIILPPFGSGPRIDYIIANIDGTVSQIKGDEGEALTEPIYNHDTQFPLGFVLITDTSVTLTPAGTSTADSVFMKVAGEGRTRAGITGIGIGGPASGFRLKVTGISQFDEARYFGSKLRILEDGANPWIFGQSTRIKIGGQSTTGALLAWNGAGVTQAGAVLDFDMNGADSTKYALNTHGGRLKFSKQLVTTDTTGKWLFAVDANGDVYRIKIGNLGVSGGGGSTPSLAAVTAIGHTTTTDIESDKDAGFVGILGTTHFGSATLNNNGTGGGYLELTNQSGFGIDIKATNVTSGANRVLESPNVGGTIALRAADSTGSPINMVYQGIDGLFHKAAVPAGGASTLQLVVDVGNVITDHDAGIAYKPVMRFKNSLPGDSLNVSVTDDGFVDIQGYHDGNEKLRITSDGGIVSTGIVIYNGSDINANDNVIVSSSTGIRIDTIPDVSGTIALRAADSTGSPINMVYQGIDGLFHKAAVPGGSAFSLTDGNGTTANGTGVDLGGTITSNVNIDGTFKVIFGDPVGLDEFQVFSGLMTVDGDFKLGSTNPFHNADDSMLVRASDGIIGYRAIPSGSGLTELERDTMRHSLSYYDQTLSGDRIIDLNDHTLTVTSTDNPSGTVLNINNNTTADPINSSIRFKQDGVNKGQLGWFGEDGVVSLGCFTGVPLYISSPVSIDINAPTVNINGSPVLRDGVNTFTQDASFDLNTHNFDINTNGGYLNLITDDPGNVVAHFGLTDDLNGRLQVQGDGHLEWREQSGAGIVGFTAITEESGLVFQGQATAEPTRLYFATKNDSTVIAFGNDGVGLDIKASIKYDGIADELSINTNNPLKINGIPHNAEPTYDIDLSLGDYTITKAGLYTITNASGGVNSIIFPDPSTVTGQMIKVINTDASIPVPFDNSNGFAPVTPDIATLSTIDQKTVFTIESNGTYNFRIASGN